jgi:uncharacterized protein YukE
MSDQKETDSSLVEELQNLGRNLAQAAKLAMTNPEWKKLQDEMDRGLTGLGQNLRQGAQSLTQTDVGQKLNGVESAVRTEFISALRTVNSQIQKTTTQWSAPGEAAAKPTEASAEPESPAAPVEPATGEAPDQHQA